MNLHATSRTLLTLALGLLQPVLALSLETAAMKLPPDLEEAAVRLPVSGYGGANRGTYSVDEYRGEFERVETRLAIFDPLFASHRGGAQFTMNGPGIDGTISADCSFKQNVATAGIVTFDLKKFAFVCDISGAGADLSGRLVLGEPRPKGFKERLLARATRRGVAEVGGRTIEIESVHDYAGSKFQSQAPVGYVLKADSQVLGALELTDVNPTVFVTGSSSAKDRLATLVAAIAVSLLRDPADSTLAD